MPNYRFFQRTSDSAWLARMDKESPLSTAEAVLHCAAEYGIPVRAVEAILSEVDFDALRALRLVGAIFPPPQPPPPLTAEQQAWVIATVTEKLNLIAKKLGFVR